MIEERVNSDTDPNRQFVWGLRYIDNLILRDRDTTANGTLDERLYALQDANWNVTAITDTTGAVQQRFAYEPYGTSIVLTANFTATTDAGEWDYRFTGRDHSAATGLHYFRTRYYHDCLGLFISRDLLQYVDDTSLYAAYFVPHASDPFGLICCSECPHRLRKFQALAKCNYLTCLQDLGLAGVLGISGSLVGALLGCLAFGTGPEYAACIVSVMGGLAIWDMSIYSPVRLRMPSMSSVELTYYAALATLTAYALTAVSAYVGCCIKAGAVTSDLVRRVLVSLVGIISLLLIGIGIPFAVCADCTPVAKSLSTGVAAFGLAIASVVFLIRYGRATALSSVYLVRRWSLRAACAKAHDEEEEAKMNVKGYAMQVFVSSFAAGIVAAVVRWILAQGGRRRSLNWRSWNWAKKGEST